MSEHHSAQGGAIRTTTTTAGRRGQAVLQAARRKKRTEQAAAGCAAGAGGARKENWTRNVAEGFQVAPRMRGYRQSVHQTAAGAEPLWEPRRLASPRGRHVAGHCLRIGAAIQQHRAPRHSTGVANSCMPFQTRCIHRRRGAHTLCPPRSRPEPGGCAVLSRYGPCAHLCRDLHQGDGERKAGHCMPTVICHPVARVLPGRAAFLESSWYAGAGHGLLAIVPFGTGRVLSAVRRIETPLY